MRDEVIRNKVFPMLFILIMVMTLSSYTVSKILLGSLGVTYQNIVQNILLNPYGVVITTILYFLFFILALGTVKIRYVNIITSVLFALIMGIGIFGTVFYFADVTSAQIIPEALILTSGTFIVAILFQFTTKKDLTHWTWYIIFLLLIALGLTFAVFFVQASLFRIIFDLFFVLIFFLIVMYDMFMIRENLPDEMWMSGVLEFFLDFANILIRIILLL
ncbi:MAG: Bax inhibitor-1 family protein, partial [Candidatus Ranarchaeia archaeon]